MIFFSVKLKPEPLRLKALETLLIQFPITTHLYLYEEYPRPKIPFYKGLYNNKIQLNPRG